MSLVGTRRVDGGYAAVYLDGALQSPSVSFYNATTQYRYTVWTRAGLINGPHTVQVNVQGTRPTASKNTFVFLDAFKVGPTSIEQTSTAVRETFRRTTSALAGGGNYDVAIHATSIATGRPSFAVTFRGTRVSVKGIDSTTSGKAVVYLDNVLQATVDMHKTSTYATSIWTSPTLSNGVHTVRIDALGTATGTASYVGIDSVTVS